MTDFIFAIEHQPGVFEEVPHGASFVAGTALHPWDVACRWTDADLAAMGCYRVPRAEVPAGHTLVSQHIERVGEVVTHVLVTEPVPVPEPEPITVAASSAKLILDKDGIYDQVEAMCLAHPVKAVRIFWESANTWVEDNAYVLAIGVEFNLSAETIHSMFQRALLK